MATKHQLLALLKDAFDSLESISDITHFEDGECVTHLDAREIELIHGDATQHLVKIHTALTESGMIRGAAPALAKVEGR